MPPESDYCPHCHSKVRGYHPQDHAIDCPAGIRVTDKRRVSAEGEISEKLEVTETPVIESRPPEPEVESGQPKREQSREELEAKIIDLEAALRQAGERLQQVENINRQRGVVVLGLFLDGLYYRIEEAFKGDKDAATELGMLKERLEIVYQNVKAAPRNVRGGPIPRG